MIPSASKLSTIGSCLSMTNKIVKFTVGSSTFKGDYLGWNGKYHVVFYKGKRILMEELQWK